MTAALILGVGSAEAAYAARLLLARGYDVVLADWSGGPAGRLARLGVEQPVVRLAADELPALIEGRVIDEIYDLTGYGDDAPDTILAGKRRLLAAVTEARRRPRILNGAASSCFGDAPRPAALADPGTRVAPRTSVGSLHAQAMAMMQTAREQAGLFAVSAVMFPSASRLNLLSGVGALIGDIAAGNEPADLGGISHIDLGWTAEYVDPLWRMLQVDTARDEIIATGEMIEIEQLTRQAAVYFGRDRLEPSGAARPTAEWGGGWRGDATGARASLGWRATTFGPELIEVLCEGAAAELAEG